MKSKLFGIIVAVLMLVGILFPLATPAKAEAPMPIIFVHGGSGSAAQFESQAMRFTSNGYPQNLIFAFEYDSSSWLSPAYQTATLARLDTFIADVKAATVADKVYILGHSLGTTVMHAYLATPARAANIAKYVNIDGRTALAPPGEVPTLAIWAGLGTPGRLIVGATNVTIPNQTHVQVATSAESFVEMYKFFTGNPPVTDQIVPEPPGQVRLAGRACFFPQNVGVEGATLQIWEVNGATGARISARPKATYPIGADGNWGPFKAQGLKHYEFVIVREGARPHHFYFEPFIRSDYLVRLNTSPPGGIGDYMDRSDGHSNLVITRNKEFWGDQGVNNDILQVNDVNIVTASYSLAKRVIGIFAYDRYADGVTVLTPPIPYYHAVTFMTGVDIYIPGADPPDGTISLVLTPRGGGGKTQVVNVPNWASSNHAISVPFNDYLQDVIAFPPGLN